jgi:CheY-like chemotaxis protein
MGRTVLFVDDEPLILRCLARELRGTASRVLTAASPEEGLQLLARERVDVLVTDYRMPEMTGAELVRRARRLQPALEVVVLSATPDDALHDLGEVRVPVLEKPWHPAGLLELIFPAGSGAVPQAA